MSVKCNQFLIGLVSNLFNWIFCNAKNIPTVISHERFLVEMQKLRHWLEVLGPHVVSIKYLFDSRVIWFYQYGLSIFLLLTLQPVLDTRLESFVNVSLLLGALVKVCFFIHFIYGFVVALLGHHGNRRHWKHAQNPHHLNLQKPQFTNRIELVKY